MSFKQKGFNAGEGTGSGIDYSKIDVGWTGYTPEEQYNIQLGKLIDQANEENWSATKDQYLNKSRELGRFADVSDLRTIDGSSLFKSVWKKKNLDTPYTLPTIDDLKTNYTIDKLTKNTGQINQDMPDVDVGGAGISGNQGFENPVNYESGRRSINPDAQAKRKSNRMQRKARRQNKKIARQKKREMKGGFFSRLFGGGQRLGPKEWSRGEF